MATLHKVLPAETSWSRLRRAALWLLFAGLLLIPKVLGIRRRASIWNAARLIAGAIGAGLTFAAWEGWRHGTFAALFGVLLLILAAAIPPERSAASSKATGAVPSAAISGEQTDALARKLGAAIVLRGGGYSVNGACVDTRFFLGSDNLWVLDVSSAILLTVPVAKLSHLRCEAAADGAWKLGLAWGSGAAEFRYDGPFAEHFARVAESTVRSLMPGRLPILR